VKREDSGNNRYQGEQNPWMAERTSSSSLASGTLRFQHLYYHSEHRFYYVILREGLVHQYNPPLGGESHQKTYNHVAVDQSRLVRLYIPPYAAVLDAIRNTSRTIRIRSSIPLWHSMITIVSGTENWWQGIHVAWEIETSSLVSLEGNLGSNGLRVDCPGILLQGSPGFLLLGPATPFGGREGEGLAWTVSIYLLDEGRGSPWLLER